MWALVISIFIINIGLIFLSVWLKRLTAEFLELRLERIGLIEAEIKALKAARAVDRANTSAALNSASISIDNTVAGAYSMDVISKRMDIISAQVLTLRKDLLQKELIKPAEPGDPILNEQVDIINRYGDQMYQLLTLREG